MQLVVTQGTADRVGFPASLHAAVKTGTAQTGNPQANTDNWMIGFAPANDPKIAVAVVVPNQNFVDTGAGVAGPIMKQMLEAALSEATSRAHQGSSASSGNQETTRSTTVWV